VKYPGYSRDVIFIRSRKRIYVATGDLSVSMQLTSANAEAAAQIKAESQRVLTKAARGEARPR